MLLFALYSLKINLNIKYYHGEYKWIIGCRQGSTRVKFKNLSLLNNKPLFTYLIMH